MCKGSGSQTTTTTSQPPPQLMQAYQNVVNQAQNVANTPYTPYGGQLVAGFTPMQQQGFQAVANAQGTAQPYINQAAQYANQATTPITPTQFSGQQIGQYMSPFTQDVINSTMANIQQQNATQQQQVMGNATAAGAYGGDRMAVAQAQLANQQALAENQTIGQLENQAYTQGLGEFNTQQQVGVGAQEASQWLQSNAGFELGNLGQLAQGSQLSGASALLSAGNLQQQLQQEQLNVPYEQYLAQQAYPFQTTNFLAGVTEGTGGLMGGSGTTTAPGPNQGQQVFGDALGAGSLAAMFMMANRGGRIPRDSGGYIPTSISAAPDFESTVVPSDTPSVNVIDQGPPAPPRVSTSQGSSSGSMGGNLLQLGQTIRPFMSGSGGIGGTVSGDSSGAGGGISSIATPAAYAALIGMGKNVESSNPNSPVGQGLLAGLGPSASQIAKDPVGMGIPTALGVPFLTPFTSSKKAQATKPEWQSLFSLGAANGGRIHRDVGGGLPYSTSAIPSGQIGVPDVSVSFIPQPAHAGMAKGPPNAPVVQPQQTDNTGMQTAMQMANLYRGTHDNNNSAIGGFNGSGLSASSQDALMAESMNNAASMGYVSSIDPGGSMMGAGPYQRGGRTPMQTGGIPGGTGPGGIVPGSAPVNFPSASYQNPTPTPSYGQVAQNMNAAVQMMPGSTPQSGLPNFAQPINTSLQQPIGSPTGMAYQVNPTNLAQLYAHPTMAGSVTGYERGGRIGYDVGGDILSAGSQTAGQPVAQGNPMVGGMMQRFTQMPTEQLQQLSVRIPPNTPQGQLLQRALMQKHMSPGAGQQQSAIGTPQQAMGPQGPVGQQSMTAPQPTMGPTPGTPGMWQGGRAGYDDGGDVDTMVAMPEAAVGIPPVPPPQNPPPTASAPPPALNENVAPQMPDTVEGRAAQLFSGIHAPNMSMKYIPMAGEVQLPQPGPERMEYEPPFTPRSNATMLPAAPYASPPPGAPRPTPVAPLTAARQPARMPGPPPRKPEPPPEMSGSTVPPAQENLSGTAPGALNPNAGQPQPQPQPAAAKTPTPADTAGAPEEFHSAYPKRSPWEVLAAIGAGMASSRSPTFAGALGEGLGAGIRTMEHGREAEMKDWSAQQKAKEFTQTLGLSKQRLDNESKHAAAEQQHWQDQAIRDQAKDAETHSWHQQQATWDQARAAAAQAEAAAAMDRANTGRTELNAGTLVGQQQMPDGTFRNVYRTKDGREVVGNSPVMETKKEAGATGGITTKDLEGYALKAAQNDLDFAANPTKTLTKWRQFYKVPGAGEAASAGVRSAVGPKGQKVYSADGKSWFTDPTLKTPYQP